jgi:RNA polymerase sigma-70 factor (ECF subfamily)
VLYNELQHFLNQTIEELPPKRKEVFKLSRIEGLTYREIADRMKISENTVDVQIRKALGFLRNAFENYYLV